MLAYAAREFFRNARLEDGSTQREHDDSYFRQTGEHYEGCEPLVCPPDAAYLFGYWCSMSARRTNGFSGMNPITEEGVIAWQRRRGITLSRIENEAIDAIENMYFRSMPKTPKK